jgi:glucarate dehydratase
MLIGRDPWNRDAIWHDCFRKDLWFYRESIFNLAYPGIDMALWDICGKACGQPLWRLLGGLREIEVSYFYYLSRGSREHLEREVADGLQAGFDVFYLKVGVDDDADLEMVSAVREALGPGPRLRLDANGSWTARQARRNLRALGEYGIDFVEQPVREHPVGHLADLRSQVDVPVCANEGLWSEADAYARIAAREADVYCFSSYWVGSLGAFHRLAHVAHHEGLQVCKHTHGELGLAAAAGQHVALTLPNGAGGHQQTAYLMEHDILTEEIPIARGPSWGAIAAPGLGVEVSEDAVREAAARYATEGQYRPWQEDQLAREGA